MSATPSYGPIIRGEALDFYLSQGYYRMGQDLFTCRFLPIDGELYTVHWLRLVLDEVHYGPKQRRLLRLNEQFAVHIRPFYLTDELEDLYALYRSSITFDAPATVEQFLLAGATHNIFATQVIEVRDEGKLIAAGIFDSGLRTLAGIMNFYDPSYHTRSLGKYLMLLKINHARNQQRTYYYPGYLVQHYPKFDYKLFPCLPATEVFDYRTNQWVPFSWEAVTDQSAALLVDLQQEGLGEDLID
jgi:arginyl-tRNA--protein-N-Asp/Glu arginylyltransferase